MKDPERSAPLPSPLDAIPDMRATAKWTIASLGAVGAALVTVVPLSMLDRLHGTADLISVIIGFTLGTAGVAWAVWHTSEALTPPVTTLSDINDRSLAALRRRTESSPESFFGPFGTTTAELIHARRFHESVHTKLLDALGSESDPLRIAAWQRALDQAYDNVALAQSLQRQLLEFMHAWQVRTARAQTMIGIAAIVIGLMLLMIAAYES
jgi:hypothetical protein